MTTDRNADKNLDLMKLKRDRLQQLVNISNIEVKIEEDRASIRKGEANLSAAMAHIDVCDAKIAALEAALATPAPSAPNTKNDKS